MAYRIRDLQNLIQQYGQLSSLPYALLLRILERIEVAGDGKISVFLLGAFNRNRTRPHPYHGCLLWPDSRRLSSSLLLICGARVQLYASRLDLRAP